MRTAPCKTDVKPILTEFDAFLVFQIVRNKIKQCKVFERYCRCQFMVNYICKIYPCPVIRQQCVEYFAFLDIISVHISKLFFFYILIACYQLLEIGISISPKSFKLTLVLIKKDDYGLFNYIPSGIFKRIFRLLFGFSSRLIVGGRVSGSLSLLRSFTRFVIFSTSCRGILLGRWCLSLIIVDRLYVFFLPERNIRGSAADINYSIAIFWTKPNISIFKEFACALCLRSITRINRQTAVNRQLPCHIINRSLYAVSELTRRIRNTKAYRVCAAVRSFKNR